ncbi:gliding motility-associated-like protein [Flavobacterium arsenatis]|uniref:Gliding motility-associated-like protein n=1 Tax=Flavobacterium arsenatis TaxID=1484332 RepID=A0ABU1TUA4_9FLAO|nr:PKD domain-containing protein [Flavobacterium arsenatis]MDR6969426.1 gliding motility-associated-like protein [Flavobacterium arsenatis]
MKQLYKIFILLLIVLNGNQLYSTTRSTPLLLEDLTFLPTATITANKFLTCVDSTSPIVTFIGAGGTAPYTFSYTIDGVLQPEITTVSDNSISVLVPTNTPGPITYQLVSVTDSSGTQSQTTSVTINIINPTVDFTSDSSASTCSGDVIVFTSQISNGTPTYTYQWDFGDGNTSNLENPTHTFNSFGCGTATFTVLLTIFDANGCSATISHQVTVKQQPNISFVDQVNPFDPFSNCFNASSLSPDYEITVGNSSSSTCIVSYSINWGDGNTENNVVFPISHIYNQLGAYDMVITALGTNGCSVSQSYLVKNVTNPSGGLTSPGNTQNLCAPTAPLQFMISNWGMNSPETTYQLTYGDGTPPLVLTQSQLMASPYYNAANPALSQNYPVPHSYAVSNCPATQFVARLRVTNACGSTTFTVDNIIILEPAEPEFTAPAIACEDTNIFFDNTTSVGFGPNCTQNALYTWNFGDGTPIVTLSPPASPDINHTFTTPGTYTVSLSATNFCGATAPFTKTICIESPLASQFSLNSSEGCIPFAVTATNTTDISQACETPNYLWTVAYADGNCGTASDYTFTNGTSSASANPSFLFASGGTYTLTLTATNSCSSSTTSQIITVKQPPTATIDPIADVCGPVTLNPTATINSCAPASEVLTYTWNFPGGLPATSNAAVPGPITYNAPGDYTISFTVSNGCGASVVATETFTVKAVPVIMNTDLTQTICSGSPTTAITLTSDVPGTTFSWTATATAGISGFIPSGSTSVIPVQTIVTTNPASGTVTYSITPSLDGCVGAVVNYTITVDPAPVITSQPISNSICEGGTLPDLSVAYINGGVPAYQWYSNTVNSTIGATLIPGETNAVFTPPSVTVGVTYYFVALTFPSGGGCSSITSDIASIEVTPGTIITTQPTSTQNLCVGATIENPLTVAYSGGAGTPSFQWYSNTTNANTGGTLIAGATSAAYTPPVFTTSGTFYYYVVVTLSGSGCGPATSDVAEIIVVNDPVITSQPLASQILCAGVQPTDLSVAVSGGIGIFTYQWFRNIANNTTSGTLIAGATTPNYTPPTATAGTTYYYAVITQTGIGCNVTSATAAVIVNPAPSIVAQPASSTICLGQVPTLLSVSYANGVGTPTFQWYSNTVESTVGAIPISGANTDSYAPPFSSVGILYYFVVITFSDGGCTEATSDIAAVSINERPEISSGTIVICSGNTFTFVPNTPGDIVPTGTMYTWSTPVVSPAGTITGAAASTTPQSTISQNLINTTNSPATVTYTVTPISGICPGAVFTVTVTVNPSVNPNAVVVVNTCFGVNSGAIQTNITGGVPFPTGDPYVILWSGPNGFTSSAPNISNLAAGVYQLSVTDQGGCPFSGSFTITEPADIVITTDSETDITCFGDANGAISISVSGGTGAYTYNWTKDTAPFATTEDLSNLGPGVYEVSVSDANGCGPKTASFTITEPPVLTLALANQVDVICFGAATGSISVNVAGGTPAYTFTWTGPNGFISNTQNLNNIPAGVYNLTLMDASGCNQNLTVTINQPTEIIITATKTEIACFGSNNASISVTVTGGNAPYQIAWSNLGTGFFQDNLSSGDYTITITDASNCVKSITVNIPEAPLFDINPVATNISCFGANDGSINLNLVGGLAPVTLVWSDGSNAGTVRNNLSAGTYTVTITDSKPCVITETFIIVEPQALVLSANVTDAFDCNNANSGAINLLVSGGTAPFTYTWSNGVTIEDLVNIPAGNYQITVTDARGCSQNALYVVNRQAPLVIAVDTETIADCEAETINQLFEAQVSGGVPPYQLNWSSGTVSGANNELMETSQSGTVILSVTDVLGCTATYSFSVEVPNIGSTSFTQTSFAFNAFGSYSINDPIQFTNTSTGDYESLVWDFGDGIVSSEENPIHIYTREGTYEVKLTAVYPFGCTYVYTVTLLIDQGYKLMMPTGFTPNADNINDTFTPVFTGMTSIEMSVYDTWGEMIYFEKGESIRGWDGTIKGSAAENGNYFFKVNATTFYGGEVKQDGTLTLIK